MGHPIWHIVLKITQMKPDGNKQYLFLGYVKSIWQLYVQFLGYYA